jgi:nucleotide-binding universal stress UspA family protein
MEGARRWTAVRKILTPTDFSAASLPGVLRAAELARRLGAELILTTAMPRPRTAAPGRGPYLDQVVETLRLKLASWFSRRVPPALREGLSVRFVGVVGSPHEVILDVANIEAVDLIVMSTHGRGGLQRLFHGSVAEAVVRASSVPVLTIRSDGDRKRAAA